MSRRSDAEFERLIQEFDTKMSGVRCSIPTYIDGLKAARDHIEIAIEAAKGSLREQKRKEPPVDFTKAFAEMDAVVRRKRK